MSNRSISSSIWHHPFFRKHQWFVREIFIYIFSAAADDEGRFLADSENILEDCFPRSYPVTVEDVQLALETLHEGGLVYLYGDRKQYGFCTGWYEHQKLDKRYRDESSYPAPPVLISSWQQADSIKEKYTKERSMTGGNARYDDAIRWYTALSNETVTGDSRETRGRLAGDSRETRAQPNLTQPNLTDKDSPQPSEHPDVAAPDLTLQIEVTGEPPPAKPPTPTAQLAEAVWLLFKQELPCSSKVYAAAGQFLQVHGEPGADKFLRWLQVSGLAVVPEGAKPDACIAKTIREGNSQSFKWKEDNNPPRRLQMSIGNTQWPKETEVI